MLSENHFWWGGIANCDETVIDRPSTFGKTNFETQLIPNCAVWWTDVKSTNEFGQIFQFLLHNSLKSLKCREKYANAENFRAGSWISTLGQNIHHCDGHEGVYRISNQDHRNLLGQFLNKSPIFLVATGFLLRIFGSTLVVYFSWCAVDLIVSKVSSDCVTKKFVRLLVRSSYFYCTD